MALSPYTAAYARLRALKKRTDQAKFSGVKPSVLLYVGVGFIALLKDLLDLAIGFIPGVVTVVAFCLTFLIWMLLFLFDRSGARTNKKMIQAGILTAVGIFEGIAIGFDYLPMETLSVVLLYILANRAYEKSQQGTERQTAAENRRINAEIRSLQLEEVAEERAQAEAVAQAEAEAQVEAEQRKNAERADNARYDDERKAA